MQWFVSQVEKDSPKVFIKSTTHSCTQSLSYIHRWDWRCSKATAKESFYNDGDILVDDAKVNREAWEKVGGTSINAYFKAPVKMIDALKALI